MEAHQDKTDVTSSHVMAYLDSGEHYAFNSRNITANHSSLPCKRPADGEIYFQRPAPVGPTATPRWVDPRLLTQPGHNFTEGFNYSLSNGTLPPSYSDPMPLMDVSDMSGLFSGIDMDTVHQVIPTLDTSSTLNTTTPSGSNDENLLLEESQANASESSLISLGVPEPETSMDKQQWLKHKRMIQILYAEEGLSLKSTRSIMHKFGYLKGASERMFKARVQEWSFQKNVTKQKLRPARKGQDSQLLSLNDLAGMKEGVDSLCTGHLRSDTEWGWSLGDDFRVVEDEWDDAWGDTAEFIDKLLKGSGASSIDDLNGVLKPMVETLGLFSLPAIFALVVRMCRKLQNVVLVRQTVGAFLLKCQKIAENMHSDRHSALIKVLKHTYSISQQDTESLASLVEVVFSIYIGFVNTFAKSESATALSLVSFYLVYVNPESWRLEVTLEKLYRLLDRSEEINGREDDATLDILGLAIFILQKTDKKVDLANNCNSMKNRIDKRRPTPDAPLEGKLLNRYLDATAALANLSKDGSSRADRNAMDYMEQYKQIQEQNQAKQDAYGKVLDEQFEEMKKRFETTSLS